MKSESSIADEIREILWMFLEGIGVFTVVSVAVLLYGLWR